MRRAGIAALTAQERLARPRGGRYEDGQVDVLDRAVALDEDGLRVAVHHVARVEGVGVGAREPVEGDVARARRAVAPQLRVRARSRRLLAAEARDPDGPDAGRKGSSPLEEPLHEGGLSGRGRAGHVDHGRRSSGLRRAGEEAREDGAPGPPRRTSLEAPGR